MEYKYCVAKNWGKGFIEAHESRDIGMSGLPGNIWKLPINNKHANLWVAKVEGVYVTKEEAQAIIDPIILANQAEFDALTEEEQARNHRPETIVLE
jgi:hypothetical protein